MKYIASFAFRLLLSLFMLCLSSNMTAQELAWPDVNADCLPGMRWWWMGSAVDSTGLDFMLRHFASAGVGSVEITPIYGVRGNEERDIAFLSDRWMGALQLTAASAKGLGLYTDMNTGTGWPFGGPNIDTEHGACKLLVREYAVTGGADTLLTVIPNEEKQRDYARLERLMGFSDRGERVDLTDRVLDGVLHWLAPEGHWRLMASFCGRTFQKVKRAAPGGEGLVMDHFSMGAVQRYLQGFSRAFGATGTAVPHLFFNDSYEVYGADWTPGLFDEFFKRRGYRLELWLPEFLAEVRSDTTARIVTDYRETLGELLLEHFTVPWTEWAHGLGAGTRCQAHGSPGNLIDLYGAVDVPECEGFGISDFGIRGLRRDSLTRPNFSDLSMLKYASSAAHVAGRRFASAETLTWLTEHFRTSLAQCKPEVDLMFAAGVNRVFFHGAAYSPADVPWPGWRFYAAVDMSPTNSIWRDAPAFFGYVSRCQGFLQEGRPDNELLLYLPMYDIWHEQKGRLLLMDIHHMKERAPRFIGAVNDIVKEGYDVDYISDGFIMKTNCVDGRLMTPGGNGYRALVVPGARRMPVETLRRLLELADEGACIVFLDGVPEDVPGWHELEERRRELALLKDELLEGRHPNVVWQLDGAEALASTGAKKEVLRSVYGLSCIRRCHERGYIYFIAALSPHGTEGWVPLGTEAASALWFNPMNGRCGRVPVRQRNGDTEVYMQLESGESAVLKTFTDVAVPAEEYEFYKPKGNGVCLDGEWEFEFVECEPKVTRAPERVRLGSWTELEGDSIGCTMGTARYAIGFEVAERADEWLLQLGDVRESARVRINGVEVQTVWAAPFECYVGRFLHPGPNWLEVEVTNLPANRIAEMDRQDVPWRRFKEINMTTIDYKKGNYAHWQPMESGLLGPVRLVPMECVTY